jgi:putative ABC transport system permease protein
MFLRLFLRIFVIAGAAAIPVAWWAAYKWLQGFAYRTSISPTIFVISLLGLLMITLLTVSYEILKSARVSPVKSLRTE